MTTKETLTVPDARILTRIAEKARTTEITQKMVGFYMAMAQLQREGKPVGAIVERLREELEAGGNGQTATAATNRQKGISPAGASRKPVKR